MPDWQILQAEQVKSDEWPARASGGPADFALAGESRTMVMSRKVI